MATTLVDRILSLVEGSASEGFTVEAAAQQKIEQTLAPLIEDAETTAQYLEQLGDVDEDRVAQYVNVIQVKAEDDETYAQTWDTLVDAAKNIKKSQDDEEEIVDENGDEEDGDEGSEDEEQELYEEGYKAGCAACTEGKMKMGGDMPKKVVEKGAAYMKGYKKAQKECAAKAAKAASEMDDGKTSEDEKKMATQQVASPGTKAANFDMVLFNEESDDPHYSVFADGRPLAEIRLADQKNPAEIRDLFTSDDYSQSLMETMAQQGPQETLEAVKARFYQAEIEQGELAKVAAIEAESHLEEQYAERLAALKENFLNTVNLATLAANKGQFVRNHLRIALKKSLRDAGVRNADDVIDDAWNEGAPEFFQTIFAKAEEWMKFSPEALSEVTKELVGSDVSTEHENAQVEAEMDEEDIQESRQRAASAARGTFNVPIVTAGLSAHSGETDLRSHYRNVMGFSGRMASRMGGKVR